MHKLNKLLLILVVVFGLGISAWYNRTALFDIIRLYNYHPPVAISNLVSEDEMTPYAQHLFYVYHPQLQNSTSFNKSCNVTPQAIVLGCTVIGKGIYLYNVTDPSLKGVDQVTAAYEMLHVGYSRLSISEREYIDKLINNTYYQDIAPNYPLIKSEVASYYATEGASAIPNELHSVLGTEVSTLPPALDSYYSKYFKDRQLIVNYANQYENVFTQREEIVSEDDTQLSQLQKQILANEDSLSSQSSQINQMQQTLQSEKNSGDIQAYNAGINPFNSEVNSYNNLVNQTRSLISQYNQLVDSRNAVAVSENKLVQSISSLPSTIQ